MTSVSTNPAPLIARSNDGSLIGVHHYTNQSSCSSSSNNKAGLIRCYDGNVSNGSLKFTLRVPLLSPSSKAVETTLSLPAGGGETQSTLRKFVFAHGGTTRAIPSHLCGMLQQSPSPSSATSILVWDLDRGVLAHTIDVRSTAASTSKKKKHKSSFDAAARTEVVCDIATHGDQLYALILFPVEDGGGSNGKGKCRLYQYDLSANEVTLVKKIKVGSTIAGSLNRVAISQASIAVRMGHHVRVLDLITGERRGKIDIPSVITPSTNEADDESDSQTLAAPLCITSDGRYIITTAANNQVVVFSDKDELKMMALCSTKDDTYPITNLDFTVDIDGDHRLMLLAFQASIASLFIVSAKNRTPETMMVPQMPQTQLCANTKEAPSFIHAGFHPHNPKESMLLLFQFSNKQRRGGSAAGSGTNLPMESLSYDNLEGRVIVGTSLSVDDKNAKGEGKKRKPAESLALAPGDQGQEASMAVDLTVGKMMAKVQRKGGGEHEEDADLCDMEVDEEQGQSIAERLALLSSAMEQSDDEEDEEYDDEAKPNKTDVHKSKFKLKSATSETLSTLLTQALSSNDTVQLNIALQVTDRRLVEGTVRALQLLDAERYSEQDNESGAEATTAGYLSTLMAHVVRRMARRHSLVMPLGVWVRAILVAAARSSTNQALHSGGGNSGGTDERMAKEGREIAMKLGPLKNFLNERVESFPQLLRLEGRLGLLNQQL